MSDWPITDKEAVLPAWLSRPEAEILCGGAVPRSAPYPRFHNRRAWHSRADLQRLIGGPGDEAGVLRYMEWRAAQREKTLARMPARGRAVVYFIEAVGLERVKIGWTNCLSDRLKTLATASPVELFVLHWSDGVQDMERRIQKHFASKRVRNEWFALDDELRDFIAVAKSLALKGARTRPEDDA